MKTLNNNKINLNFPKPTFLVHNRALSHKGLKPATNQQSKKASYNEKHKTQFLLSNHHKLHLWPMSLSKRNQTIPKFNPSILS